MRYLALGIYLACIVGANWAINHYGFVSVGFGLMAPAGVWFAGLSFSGRDLLQRLTGRGWVIAAILVGAALSWFISPSFAVASGVAFLVSESMDMAIYTPLYRRHPFASVIASNSVGAVVDSLLFLWLAFGSTRFWEGQVVGKMWTVIPVVLGMAVWRNGLPQRTRLRVAS